MVTFAKIVQKSITYQQEPDSCSSFAIGDPHEAQRHVLTIETHDAGAGPFVRIITGGWAIDEDNLDEIPDMIRKLIADMEP